MSLITQQTSSLNPGKFQSIPGTMLHADIYIGGDQPAIVGVDTQGQAFLLDKDLQTWQPIVASNSPQFTSISIGKPGNTIQTSWGIDIQNMVYRLTSSGWAQIPGTLIQVSVGNEHEVWGVDAQNVGWRKKDPQENKDLWQSLSGKISHIAAGGDGTAWGISQDYTLATFNRLTGIWNHIVKPADLGLDNPARIELKDKYNVVLLNNLGKIYRLYPGTTGKQKTNWIDISENKTYKHVSIGIDGTIVALDTSGQSFIRQPSVAEQNALKKARGQSLRAGQMVRLFGGPNVGFAGIWTRANSAYDPDGTLPAPNNHLELVCGGTSQQDQVQGNFFSIIISGDPSSNRILNYGDSVEVLSLYATSGLQKLRGPLGKSRKWWSHFPHYLFKKDWADVPVTLTTHPRTNDGSQIFTITSPLGLTGTICEGDPIQFESQAPETIGRKLILNPSERLGNGFFEPLIPKKTYQDSNDTQHLFYGARDRGGFQYFYIRPINSLRDVPPAGHEAYKAISRIFEQASAGEQEEQKAVLTTVTTDGIGVVSSVKNMTPYPLTISPKQSINAGGQIQKLSYELTQEFRLSGFAKDPDFRNFGPVNSIQLKPMWSRGFAWINKPFDTPGKTTITFLARCDDAGNIQVAFDQIPGTDAQWKIVLGGWNNSKSAILAKLAGENQHTIIAETLVNVNPLARAVPGQFVAYWITLYNGLIMVGTGEPGENLFLSAFMPQSSPMKYVGFSSHNGRVDITEVQHTLALVPFAQNRIYASQEETISLPATVGGPIQWVPIQFRVPNEGALSFGVQARQNVSLVMKNNDNQGYRVIFGSNNKNLVIQKNNQAVISLNAEVIQDAQLFEDVIKNFWVSIQGGLIIVGQGNIGDQILLAWQDQDPIVGINRFGFEPYDHIQKISKLTFAPNIILVTEKNQDLSKFYLNKQNIIGSVSFVRPFDYSLIQTGQFVTLQNKFTGETFQLVATPQQQARYPFNLIINQLGVPQIMLTQAAKNAKGLMNAKEEAKILEAVGGVVSAVGQVGGSILQYKAQTKVFDAQNTLTQDRSSFDFMNRQAQERQQKKDAKKITAAGGTPPPKEKLPEIKSITHAELKRGGVTSAQGVIMSAGAAAATAAAAAAGAGLKAAAAKGLINAEFAYRKHDSYVLVEDVKRELSAQESIPEEAKDNQKIVVELLQKAATLSFEKKYTTVKDPRDGSLKPKIIDEFPQLLALYQSILNHINHFYVVQDARVKKAIYAGLQKFASYAPKRKEYYRDFMDLFTSAITNPYLINPKIADDISGKNIWHYSLASLGFIMFNALIQQPKASATIPALFGGYLWLPGEMSDDTGWITFEAKGQNDLFVGFSQKITEIRNTNNDVYEIVFGSWNNTKTEIRVVSLGRPAVQITEKQAPDAMLHSKRYKKYWIQFKKGTISLGSGKDIGKNELLSWNDPYPFQGMKYIGIGSWDGPIKIRKIKTSMWIKSQEEAV